MVKITFLGAGSTIFVKNIIGDCMCTPILQGSTVALYDIDAERLNESAQLLNKINKHSKAGFTVETYLGVANRKAALRDADFVFNAVQIGGYEPSTVIDFEIPKRFGLKQTIADTLGVGGIFRALRTAPVMLDFCRDMEAVCPQALLLNYSNPMSMLMMSVLRSSSVKAVGLCHSVQGCLHDLLKQLDLLNKYPKFRYKIAGINHQSWLLEATSGKINLYPEIFAAYEDRNSKGILWNGDLVRLDMMKKLGYYITESSEHNAEYNPWYIKNTHPELIEKFNIPIDEYPRRCVNQIKEWDKLREQLLTVDALEQARSHEYGSYIVEAIVANAPYTFGGNVMNNGLITNLPAKACVEVMCVADGNGITPTYVGDLPEQLAAMNRNMINPQILTAEAILQNRKEYVYHAALLDPHTAAELPADTIIEMCDALFEAHGDMIPLFK